MHRLAAALAAISASLIVLAGCGQSSHVSAQKTLIAYQDRLGQINRPFARPPADPRRAVSLLRQAVSGYAALHPPAALRSAHRTLVAAGRAELASLLAAEQAVARHDAKALAAAEARNGRARRDLGRALARIGVYASACRTNAANC